VIIADLAMGQMQPSTERISSYVLCVLCQHMLYQCLVFGYYYDHL